jgi:hypothetical protein
MTDEYLQRLQKEQRAMEFLSQRSFNHVPIVPEDELIRCSRKSPCGQRIDKERVFGGRTR